MSKYSSKNAAFQFGLLLFMVAGLSFGIILTTGKASLNLFSYAQQVQTNYTAKPGVPNANPAIIPSKPNMQAPIIRIPGCRKDGRSCSANQVCCGFCNNGKCTSLKCVGVGDRCVTSGNSNCCRGYKCIPYDGMPELGVCR